MPSISATDLRSAIRYLEAARKIFKESSLPHHQDKARLIGRLIPKFKNRLKS